MRAFYDEDYDGIGEFNLDYFKPSSEYPKHVIAARITAENPDEGFKPTSGKIDRIIFQSDTKVQSPTPTVPEPSPLRPQYLPISPPLSPASLPHLPPSLP